MKSFVIYLLISEDKKKTYVGFSNELNDRIKNHRSGKIKTTKKFGNFSYKVLEKVNDIELIRVAEKYWKSAAGRKKIKEILKVKNI